MREEQKAAGKPMRYDGRWRDRAPAPNSRQALCGAAEGPPGRRDHRP
jgi:hypothetical protein